MKIRIFGYALLIVAVLNTLLLSFAYRDFSFSLLGMTLLTIIGIPSALYLIAKPPLLRHWFVAQDENGNRLHIYRDSHKDLDLEGR